MEEPTKSPTWPSQTQKDIRTGGELISAIYGYGLDVRISVVDPESPVTYAYSLKNMYLHIDGKGEVFFILNLVHSDRGDRQLTIPVSSVGRPYQTHFFGGGSEWIIPFSKTEDNGREREGDFKLRVSRQRSSVGKQEECNR